MAERGLRLRLGLFVAGSLAVLAGLVVFFGRAPDLFSNKATYSVLFPEAPGIGPGTPVRKSGVPIGEVATLDLDPDTGQVRVKIRIDRKFPPRKSEDATITRGLLSGDTAIDFLPRLDENGQPVPRGELWPPGSDIPGIPPFTARSLLTPASGVLANAQASLDRIVKAFEKLERLETLRPKMEMALDEITGLARDARGFIPELRKTNERFQNLLGADVPGLAPPAAPPALGAAGLVAALQPPDQPNVRALIRDIQELVRAVRPVADDLRAMIRRLEPEVGGTFKSAHQAFDAVSDVLSPENRKQFTELLKNANAVAVYIVKISGALTTMLESAEKAIKNIDEQVTAAGTVVADIRAVTKPLAAKSEAIVTSVSDSAEQLSKTLAEIRALLQTVARGNGTVSKLLNDPAVYQNLDDAAASLARVMSRAEKISRDLEVFSDKIARRPELIGIGGAVRPSSGLKDLPGAPLPAYHPEWPPALPARPSAGPNWLPPPVQGYPPK
jgi:phospholipid/cholesterol/gamma-HCH transport system substrate-binding protein